MEEWHAGMQTAPPPYRIPPVKLLHRKSPSLAERHFARGTFLPSTLLTNSSKVTARGWPQSPFHSPSLLVKSAPLSRG